MRKLIKQTLLSALFLLTLIVSLCVETTTHHLVVQESTAHQVLNAPLALSISSAPLVEKGPHESYFSDKKMAIKQAFSLRPSSPLLRWVAFLAVLILQALASNAPVIISKLRAFFDHCVIGKCSYYFLRLNILASQAHPPTKTFCSIA